ncbi:putative F-box/LRR-repeat protein C02F5.7 [Orchesella cincta]|uniref:Putative F-box/LRR-repeat protein C02F5.7 n=1 Tax=Orchesella cincta TaxID=48709 RepID=A0A1D2N3M9_ORCCI|nr:putative F-box/LRR-repeat protein C02F5.7 [Orchesella cincta]
MELDNLPPELIAKVFSFLDPDNIMVCRQVCRKWRILSIKDTNPLYSPQIMGLLMQKLGYRELIRLRRACKLFSVGLDKLTFREIITLVGRTDIDSCDVDALITGDRHQSNPFPSRIVKLNLNCDCSDADPPLPRSPKYALVEQYGENILFLQVTSGESPHIQNHFNWVTKHIKNLRGLVLLEASRSFSEKEEPKTLNPLSTADESTTFENLKYLRLDDSTAQLRHTALYLDVIKNSPNLEHLDTHGYFHTDMDIIRLLPTLSLTTLRIDAEDPHTQEVLEVLAKCSFPLKSFSLKIMGWGDKANCNFCTTLLHGTLARVSKTLQKLELNLHWDVNNMSNESNEGTAEPEILYTFPSSKCLTNLEKLKLVGFKGQLDFLPDFTSLKSLLIVDHVPETQQVFNSPESFKENLPILQELHLPQYRTFRSLDYDYKLKIYEFMWDASYKAKYCGLYTHDFP